MTSAAQKRDKRSADNRVAMTAENMISDDGDTAVNRPMRLKRDINDYLYSRRFIGAGKTIALSFSRLLLCDKSRVAYRVWPKKNHLRKSNIMTKFTRLIGKYHDIKR